MLKINLLKEKCKNHEYDTLVALLNILKAYGDLFVDGSYNKKDKENLNSLLLKLNKDDEKQIIYIDTNDSINDAKYLYHNSIKWIKNNDGIE